MTNRYLEKIAAITGNITVGNRSFKLGHKTFNAPDKGSTHPNIPGMRNMQWDGKKTIDPNVKPGAATRAKRLDKAKSLLAKKRTTIGVKLGLGVAAAAGVAHLGKSIINNLGSD